MLKREQVPSASPLALLPVQADMHASKHACTRCRQVVYCSKECQKAAWRVMQADMHASKHACMHACVRVSWRVHATYEQTHPPSNHPHTHHAPARACKQVLAKAAEKEQALQQLRAANDQVPGLQTLNPRNLTPTRYALNPTPGAAAAARRQQTGAFNLHVHSIYMYWLQGLRACVCACTSRSSTHTDCKACGRGARRCTRRWRT